MTTKADMSLANWTALVDAAPAIARAVGASGGSAGRSVRELDAFIQFVSDSTGGPGEDLVGQLIADVAGRLASGLGPTGDDAYTDGLEHARRAGAILAVELDPAEATAVRAWYLAGAQRVAAAAKEGGVLGIGGTDVSTWERETLQAIADALGADQPDAG